MKDKKKVIIGIICVVALIAILVGVYAAFKPQTSAGGKNITVEVVDDQGQSKTYECATDGEYLRDAMVELSATTDFSYSGDEGEYGLYITTINGLTADYDADGAYWSIYVNGEYGMYGADAQPIADGDAFTFAYEVYSAE